MFPKNLDIVGPISANGTLSLGHVDDWEDTVAQSPKLQLSRTILNHSNIRQSLVSRSVRIADAHVFNTEVEFRNQDEPDQEPEELWPVLAVRHDERVALQHHEEAEPPAPSGKLLP